MKTRFQIQAEIDRLLNRWKGADSQEQKAITSAVSALYWASNYTGAKWRTSGLSEIGLDSAIVSAYRIYPES